MLIYSSQQRYAREEIDSLFYLGNSIGLKPIDIMNCKKSKIIKIDKITGETKIKYFLSILSIFSKRFFIIYLKFLTVIKVNI